MDFLYQLYANLGTIRAHEWLRNGNKSDDLDTLRQAYSEIKTAIEIDPDAHFGREWVQLDFMAQLYVQAKGYSGTKEFEAEHEAIMAPYRAGTAMENRAQMLEGLLGIVVLGQGWNSDLVWSLIRVSLTPGDGRLAELAFLRTRELRGDDISNESHKQVLNAYTALRENGDEYVSQRKEFMLTKLEKGEHPDTHKNFWDGYEEVPRIELTQFNDRDPKPWWETNVKGWLISFGIAIPVGVLAVFYFRKAKAARR